MRATLLLVRHGETTGESSIRLNGSTDVPLSDLGRAQMAAVRAHLAAFDVRDVLTTPLSRARESARIALPSFEPVTVPDLREIDFGAWERLTYAEVRERDPERYAEMLLGQPEFRFPEGESREGFSKRVAGAVHTWIGTTAPRFDGIRVIVAHKGTVKAIRKSLEAAGALVAPPSPRPAGDAPVIPPCHLGSVAELSWGHSGWELVRWDDTRHLGEHFQPDHPVTR
jgi:broad specificity phosphatase PhoE